MLVSFAGLTVELLPKYPDTARLCARYPAPRGAVPDFSVSVTDEEILREGTPSEELSLGYLETLAIYRKIAERALSFGRLLFHGSALSYKGHGVLFTAPSGTGKSTHAALWREAFGDDVLMVNDDKPLLTASEDGVFVSGTPWDGKHALSTNCTVPLRAVCLLARGQETTIRKIRSADAYPYLLGQTYRPQDPALLSATLSLSDRVFPRVACFVLRTTMEHSAARIACRGIFGDRDEPIIPAPL